VQRSSASGGSAQCGRRLQLAQFVRDSLVEEGLFWAVSLSWNPDKQGGLAVVLKIRKLLLYPAEMA
jgi:hypothetical protein